MFGLVPQLSGEQAMMHNDSISMSRKFRYGGFLLAALPLT